MQRLTVLIQSKLVPVKLIKNLSEFFPESNIIAVIPTFSDEIPPSVEQVFNKDNSVWDVGMGLRFCYRDTALILDGNFNFTKSVFRNIPKENEESSILIDKNKQIGRDDLGVCFQNDTVLSINFGLPVKWGRAVFLQEAELNLLRKVASEQVFRKRFLFEGLNEVIDRGGKFGLFANQMGVIRKMD